MCIGVLNSKVAGVTVEFLYPKSICIILFINRNYA